MSDPFWTGRGARRANRPHNPRNSLAWKQGWAAEHDDQKDRNLGPLDEDAWMIDPEMEAKG